MGGKEFSKAVGSSAGVGYGRWPGSGTTAGGRGSSFVKGVTGGGNRVEAIQVCLDKITLTNQELMNDGVSQNS